MLQRWRAVGNSVSDLTDPRFESQTSRSRNKRVPVRNFQLASNFQIFQPLCCKMFLLKMKILKKKSLYGLPVSFSGPFLKNEPNKLIKTSFYFSGTVLHFLVRLPPFTQLFLEYQDASFDIPDRTFHSMATTFKLSSYASTTDVKELIPEFFFLPEFLCNLEGIFYH